MALLSFLFLACFLLAFFQGLGPCLLHILISRRHYSNGGRIPITAKDDTGAGKTVTVWFGHRCFRSPSFTFSVTKIVIYIVANRTLLLYPCIRAVQSFGRFALGPSSLFLALLACTLLTFH